MITFPVAVKNGFKKAFDFKGCATRAEYWWWQLFCFLIGALSAIPLYYIQATEHTIDIILLLIDALLFIPSLSVLVRRLHDVGQSWELLLYCLIPVIGLVYAVVILVVTLWEGDSYNQPSTEE